MQTATTTTTIKTIQLPQTRTQIRAIARVDLPEIGVKAGDTIYLKRTGKRNDDGTYTYQIRQFALLDHMKLDASTVLARIDNGEGKVYEVTLRASHDHSCTCPATVECVHSHFAAHVVNKLVAARKAEKAAQAAAQAKKEPVSIQERGTLNGNRPFSLLKSA